MRPQLREMLGNLGERIRNLDDAYADKVREAIQGDAQDGPRRALSEVLAAPLTYGLGQSSHSFKTNPKGALLDYGAIAGMQGLSAATRYGIPAAGLTAAGMGLAELTGQFYDQASNTPVLPM